MSDNDLSSKLTKGMRRAKQSSANEPAGGPVATSSDVVRERGRGTDPAAKEGRATTPPLPGVKRFAEQDDQAPPASLDSPWKNLHPKRIWPD